MRAPFAALVCALVAVSTLAAPASKRGNADLKTTASSARLGMGDPPSSGGGPARPVIRPSWAPLNGTPSPRRRPYAFKTMPKHVCIDPHDPYAQREVRVEFERVGSGFRLIAAIDACDDDILPDLVDAQRDDLLREIFDADRLAHPTLSGTGARPAVPC